MKRIFFIRHAMSIYNRDVELNNKPDQICYKDSKLCDTGETQAKSLNTFLRQSMAHAYNLRYFKDFQLIVTSPLQRCIQTLDYSMKELRNGVCIIAHPDVRETIATYCDIGSSIDDLEALYPFVDFSLVKQAVNWERTEKEEDVEIEKRMRAFVRWLSSRSEDSIVVFAHYDIIRMLTNGYECDNTEICECRLQDGILTVLETVYVPWA